MAAYRTIRPEGDRRRHRSCVHRCVGDTWLAVAAGDDGAARRGGGDGAAWARSLVSFQLPLSPIAVFAIRIELAHDVAIERLHHAHARHHGGSIFLGGHDLAF